MVAPILRSAYAVLPQWVQKSVKVALADRVERWHATRVLEDSVRPGMVVDGVEAAVTTSGPAADDGALTRRLMAAYRHSTTAQDLAGGSMWSEFFEAYQRALHDAFIGEDVERATGILRQPADNNLFYGFDFLCAEFRKNSTSERWRKSNAASVADSLLRLAQSIGALRYPNRERQSTGYEPIHRHSLADCLSAIEDVLGQEIVLPTPFAGEHGVSTRRGVMSYRVPQALYQAHRIRQLTHGLKNASVLEIGGGLGRTAFYSRQLGIHDYTIVDLPLTSVAQGSFLGRALGGPAIVLAGEAAQVDDGRIKLLPPDAFTSGARRYDLVMNVDSLTEMSEPVASSYLKACLSRASTLLSINHESNGFTVHGLLRKLGYAGPITRTLYPMRDGYVEEVLRLDNSGSTV